jgi:AraC-like DNA-binding protein
VLQLQHPLHHHALSSGFSDDAIIGPRRPGGLTAPDKFLTLLAMSRTSAQGLRGMVPGTYVQLLFEYLAQRGLDAPRLLREEPPPADGRSRYPVTRWRQLLERAAEALNDPLLGLHLGRSIRPAHFGVIGYALLACGTLGAAMQRMLQYQRLVYDVNPLHYRLEGSSVVLEWGVEQGRPGPLADETAIASLVQMARELCGTSFGPEQVDFVNPAPAELKPYRDYFCCPVRFGQTATTVRFPARFLALPLRHPDPALLELLARQADALLAELPGAGDLEQSVRRCIARLSREGEPTLERVASELHTTPRTLHRRLESGGHNFRGLREDTRRRLAEEYLRDPRLQLGEIARLLGFAEQSVFSRSFRRWTGRTPSAFRKEHS